MKRNEILKEAEKHFFAAMGSGWAAGVKGTPVLEMPGYEKIVYQCNDIRVVDCWGISDQGKSEGTTRIWHFKEPIWNPIWVMHYGGFYPKEVIPFLKEALMMSYKRSEFNGGRGPSWYSNNSGVQYFNNSDPVIYFSQFNGSERICSSKGLESGDREVGQHDFWGMALI